MCKYILYTNADVGDDIIFESNVNEDGEAVSCSTNINDVDDAADFVQAIVDNDFGPDCDPSEENSQTISAVEDMNSASGNI